MSKLAPAHGTAPACPGAALGGSWCWCGSPSGCGASAASSHGGANRTASGSGSGLDPVKEVTLSLELRGGRLQRSPSSRAAAGSWLELWSCPGALSLRGSSSRRLWCWLQLQRELHLRAARSACCVPRAVREETRVQFHCPGVWVGSDPDSRAGAQAGSGVYRSSEAFL